MSEALTLPVLPLDDEVVLPGMVVPIELSDTEVRGAIEAARNSRGLGRGPGIRSEENARVLLVPRIGERGLAAVGTLAVIEQVGRMPGGEPGAVLRGVSRVRIGSGTTGPGAALWVEGTVISETGQGPRANELAKEYKSLVIATLQSRGAWQVVDMIQQLDDPSAIADRAGYASYLTAEQKLTLLETVDQLSQEQHHPAPRLYEMLIGALRALAEDDAAALVPAFLLKALAFDGAAPVVDRCASCGDPEGLVAFDLAEGGLLCRACRRGRSVSPDAIDVLRRVLGGRLTDALRLPGGPLADEVGALATEAMELHLDRRLRSAHVSTT